MTDPNTSDEAGSKENMMGTETIQAIDVLRQARTHTVRKARQAHRSVASRRVYRALTDLYDGLAQSLKAVELQASKDEALSAIE